MFLASPFAIGRAANKEEYHGLATFTSANSFCKFCPDFRRNALVGVRKGLRLILR